MKTESAPTPCDICGKEADVVIETVAWCAACFHEMGSCCGTFGADLSAEPARQAGFPVAGDPVSLSGALPVDVSIFPLSPCNRRD